MFPVDDSMRAVLLCAEEDDLELVALVHEGRKRGIALEVVPGVERSLEPIAEALASDARLFVVLRSDDLTSARALVVKSAFETKRRPDQYLLAIRFDATRPDHSLAIIERRLLHLLGGADPRLPIYEHLTTGSFNVLGPGVRPEPHESHSAPDASEVGPERARSFNRSSG